MIRTIGKIISLLLLTGLTLNKSFSQETLYADKVLHYSSEITGQKNPYIYAPQQILGKPSIVPNKKSAYCSWIPATENGGIEYIAVSFKKAIVPRQVVVFETYNMGAIKEVWVYPSESLENGTQIYDNPTPQPKEVAEPLHVFPQNLNQKVKSVKVVLDTKAVPGFNVIDAIGISESNVPLEVKINLGEDPSQIATPEKIERLPLSVNSKDKDELLPVISPNGKTLYFVRKGGGVQEIWYVEIDKSGGFGEAKKFPAPINRDGMNTALLSISPDGQNILLLNEYLPNGKSAYGISSATKTRKGWTYPEKIVIEKFENKNKTGEYILSTDRQKLVMTVERTDKTYGGKDLYVSFRKKDGTYSTPRNMGATLNTASNEKSPFLAPDGKTLYFSTNGRPGFGGSDLFVTRRLDDTWLNWSEPVNLGPAINGPGFDAYYTLSAKGDYAYFSHEDASDNQDLYRIPLPRQIQPDPVVLVHGYVKNSKTDEPLGASISYYDLETGEEIGIARSDENTGYYEVILPYNRLYGFNAEERGFIALTDNIDLKEVKEYQEIERNLYLVPIEVGIPISLNNIFFYRSQARLLPTSNQELQNLLKYMEINSKTKIRIEGHTDNRGGVAANQDLSERRADAIRKYLISNGIAKKRIDVAGYGGSRPIADNASEEGRKKNRRVEFVIVKI